MLLSCAWRQRGIRQSGTSGCETACRCGCTPTLSCSSQQQRLKTPPAMPARSVLLYSKSQLERHANTTGERAAGNVQVWNEQGSVTSEAATLTVQERARPPVITAQPRC